MSKVVVVDNNDNVIGSKERDDLGVDDIYRVSALWINNSYGQVLIAQRSHKKKNSPGKWGPAVAGTVEEGEDYDINIKKEAQEELGLQGIDLKKAKKDFISRKYSYFVQWYEAILDESENYFKLQEEEVEKVAWIELEELRKDFLDYPEKYTPGIKSYLEIK